MIPEIIEEASATIISKVGTGWDNLQILAFILLFYTLSVKCTA